MVVTIAGKKKFKRRDGTKATFGLIKSIAVDPQEESVYVCDGNVIRKVYSDGMNSTSIQCHWRK